MASRKLGWQSSLGQRSYAYHGVDAGEELSFRVQFAKGSLPFLSSLRRDSTLGHCALQLVVNTENEIARFEITHYDSFNIQLHIMAVGVE
jgi:hypothetical protein